MKYVAVINPVSGTRDKQPFIDYFEEQCNYYGITHSKFETTGKNDLKKLKEFLEKEKPDRVIAVGGDGTFAVSALACMDGDIPVGVIPFGSANGLAKELGVAGDFRDALDDILKSALLRPMDIVCINGKYHCIHLADAGLNARVIQEYEKDQGRGMLTYGKYLARELSRAEMFSYKIETAGQTYEGQCSMLAIANGRKFGTGVPVTGTSNPFDGKFEIAIVGELTIETIIKAGLSAIEGIIEAGDITKVFTASEAKISFGKPQVLQSDGELLGTFDDLDISLIKGGFRYITHGGNPYLK